MRTPRNVLASVLAAAGTSALIWLLGGSGGAWIQARETRRRVQSLADDLEAIERRIARRDGEKGRLVAQERKSHEAEEIERIVASSRNGNGKRKPSPADAFGDLDLPDEAKATLAGWLSSGRRE